MGEVAALLTALCFAFSAVFFTSTSKVVGAVFVNRVRLLFAVPLLLVTHVLITGRFLPLDAEPARWLWLGLSGIVGLVIGDTLLFKGYSQIGSRLGTLVMTVVPVIGGLEAFIFLGERLTFLNIAGVTLCVCGVMLVILERGQKISDDKNNSDSATHPLDRKRYIIGLLFALGGAAGQASGLILAKIGLQNDFPPISGVMIRMLVAMSCMWLITLFSGQVRITLQTALGNPQVVRSIFGGSVAGPFIGVWLSQIAVQRTYVGVASTLMALTPVFMLPIAKWYFKEMVSPRSWMGTLVALVGVAVISH